MWTNEFFLSPFIFDRESSCHFSIETNWSILFLLFKESNRLNCFVAFAERRSCFLNNLLSTFYLQPQKILFALEKSAELWEFWVTRAFWEMTSRNDVMTAFKNRIFKPSYSWGWLKNSDAFLQWVCLLEFEVYFEVSNWFKKRLQHGWSFS